LWPLELKQRDYFNTKICGLARRKKNREPWRIPIGSLYVTWSLLTFGNKREHGQEVACALFMSHGGFQIIDLILVILGDSFPFVKLLHEGFK
jgi:hypothetical protein